MQTNRIPGQPVPEPARHTLRVELRSPIPGMPAIPMVDLVRLENRFESRRLTPDPLPHGKRRNHA